MPLRPVLPVAVSSSLSGRFTPEQLSSAQRQLEYLKQTTDTSVVVAYGKGWSQAYEADTFNSAWKRVAAAKQPMYTHNIFTSSWPGLRFFELESDLMDPSMFVVDSDLQRHQHLSEDLLIGSTGSYSEVHIDNAPCAGSRITVLEGRKELAAWPFDPETPLPDWMPVHEANPTGSSPNFTAAVWDKIKDYAVDNDGWAVELGAGDYATIPGLWWHGAFNTEFTVSINNTFMTPYDVAEVLYQTVRLGIYRVKLKDIKHHNGPVIVGKGLLDAFEQSIGVIFTSTQPWKLNLEETQRRGAWQYTASQALQAIIEARQGSRGGGVGGMQSQLRIHGFDTKKVCMLLTMLKKLMGDSPDAKRKRQKKQASSE